MHLKSHQYEFAKDIENEVCICPWNSDESFAHFDLHDLDTSNLIKVQRGLKVILTAYCVDYENDLYYFPLLT